jgi:hypothetical protein
MKRSHVAIPILLTLFTCIALNSCEKKFAILKPERGNSYTNRAGIDCVLIDIGSKAYILDRYNLDPSRLRAIIHDTVTTAIRETDSSIVAYVGPIGAPMDSNYIQRYYEYLFDISYMASKRN